MVDRRSYDCRILIIAFRGRLDYSRFQRPQLPGRLKQGLMLAPKGNSSQVVDWSGENVGIEMEGECGREIV